MLTCKTIIIQYEEKGPYIITMHNKILFLIINIIINSLSMENIPKNENEIYAGQKKLIIK